MAKTYYKREEGLNPTNQPRLRIYDSVAEAEAHLDDLNPGDVVGTKLIDEAADIAGAQNLIADALSLLQDKIPDDASAGNQCITRETMQRNLEPIQDVIPADASSTNKLTTVSTLDSTLRAFIDVLEPIGTIKLCKGTYDEDHWHICDGTNGTIDLREAVPVGTGERADLTTHDTYDVGEFKEDQLQSHGHSAAMAWSSYDAGYTQCRGLPPYTSAGTGFDLATTSVTGARTGTTTHGRQVGVVFIQKIRNYGDD